MAVFSATLDIPEVGFPAGDPVSVEWMVTG
jgi:hypothetical protein